MTTTIQEYAGDVISTVATTLQIEANARELSDLRSARKVIEDREGILRAALLDFLHTEQRDSVVLGGVAISKSAHERKGIDRSKFEALYPAVLAAVETVSTVEQIRVKIKG